MKNIIIQEEKDKIDALCTKYNIRNYKINSDGSIDVNGSVNLHAHSLIGVLPLRFGKVTGDFYCSDNKLTSLVGCPSEVGGNFCCEDNHLTSLKYCPIKVATHFDCSDNQLSSLEFCPTTINEFFDCSHNQLSSLKFCPTTIGGNFFYSRNLFPLTFREVIKKLTVTELNTFIKCQNYYDVWTPELSEENMQLLIDDIKDGLL